MKRLLLLSVAASRLAAQPTVPAWSVSPAPTLYIGSESSTQTQFDGIVGILRMPGGEIVVANGLSQELRVFSASGAYVRTLSTPANRAGMRALDRIWRGAGDTIYAAEVLPSESNVWVFTTTGFVAKKQVGAANAGGVFPVDRFPDGHFVVSAASRRTGQAPSPLTYVDSLPLGIVTFTDLAPKWVGALKTEVVVMMQGGGRGRGRVTVPFALGRRTSFAVSGDRLWIGDSETGTITQHSSAARGLAVLAAPAPLRLLDTAAVRRVRASLVSDAMNWSDRGRIDASYSAPLPRNAPRFTRFVAGVNGEMWIESFHEDPAAPPSFIVVNRSGTPIGRVTMPLRFRLLDVGSSDVMGVSTDADGLEHVARYTLTRR